MIFIAGGEIGALFGLHVGHTRLRRGKISGGRFSRGANAGFRAVPNGLREIYLRIMPSSPHRVGSTSSNAAMIMPTDAASRRSLIGVRAVVFFQSR